MIRKVLCVLGALLLIAGGGFFLFGSTGGESNGQALENDVSSEVSFLPTRVFSGVTYEARPSSSLETILFIGYDHMDEGELIDGQEGYIKGGQSDFLLLVVVDHDSKTIRQLQFDRDTMTDVKFYSKFGAYYGTRRMQICLSHAYGDTQEMNNRNAIWAVENFLGIAGENDGAQVDWYISMDITGIDRLNDLLGGVTVPIEHDFSYYDPTMVMGTTMKLNGAQAQIYCRQRYYIADQSNENRMGRQRVYMRAAADLLQERVRAESGYAMELLNGMGVIFDTSRELDADFGFTTTDQAGTPITDTPTHYLMTNNGIYSIAGLLMRVLEYDVLDVEYLPGERHIGPSGYMEFDAEKDAGVKWALDALYRPMN